MSDYESRASQFHFASKDDIANTIKTDPSTVLLDVRRPDEIAQDAPLKIKNREWRTSSCTPNSCAELETKALEMLPNKNGRRAAKAEETLKVLGYAKVLNAGGVSDLDYLKKQDESTSSSCSIQ